ncbi:FAS1 domain-containing protein [Triangularia verruculosa]|uniref:FAS1 domain-containing protein n=1 Tax=Triangularia verruculosa TaxID=2587418 RepID=A0AAN7AVF6_9PEZI|nr:FAS1 domain-containing protein [Triangularia verruculosa]
MHLKTFSLLGLASAANAQTLADVLAQNAATLSSLTTFLQSEEVIYELFANAQDVTLLAPSNEALARLNATPLANELLADPNYLTAFLAYHVLNGTYYASNLTSSPTQFIPTILDIAAYSNVTGGQRLQAQSSNNGVGFVSGNGQLSTVESANFNYTGGTIHIIDNYLTIPAALPTALLEQNLTALVGAVTQAGVAQTLTDARDITLFAPNNEAFDAIGNLVSGLTVEQLAGILGYHVIVGQTVYSNQIEDGATATTFQGGDITLRVEDGSVFVNSARVVKADVLCANGVIHVIDGVLNPSNANAEPDPAASTQAPAFPGASSTGGIPFTTGIALPLTSTQATSEPTPTSSPDGGNGGGDGAPVEAGAAAQGAALGMAALLGAGVVLAQL